MAWLKSCSSHLDMSRASEERSLYYSMLRFLSQQLQVEHMFHSPSILSSESYLLTIVRAFPCEAIAESAYILICKEQLLLAKARIITLVFSFGQIQLRFFSTASLCDMLGVYFCTLEGLWTT